MTWKIKFIEFSIIEFYLLLHNKMIFTPLTFIIVISLQLPLIFLSQAVHGFPKCWLSCRV